MPVPRVAVVMRVVTVMPLRVVRRIPSVRTVGMGVAVMPSRIVRIIIAAAVIRAPIDAHSGIAAAAGNEER
jgi:hypothetical protein